MTDKKIFSGILSFAIHKVYFLLGREIEEKDKPEFQKEIFNLIELSVITKGEILFFDFRGQRLN